MVTKYSEHSLSPTTCQCPTKETGNERMAVEEFYDRRTVVLGNRTFENLVGSATICANRADKPYARSPIK